MTQQGFDHLDAANRRYDAIAAPARAAFRAVEQPALDARDAAVTAADALYRQAMEPLDLGMMTQSISSSVYTSRRDAARAALDQARAAAQEAYEAATAEARTIYEAALQDAERARRQA